LHLCENGLMATVEVQHFLDRARDFLKGKDLLRDKKLLGDDLDLYRLSFALLGIHCAISYSDALRTGMGCEKVSLEDHSQAANDLRKRLKSRSFENLKGISHLESLIKMKNKIEYEPITIKENQIEEIMKHAKRFAEWADTTGRNQQIEGW